ncbi:MAG: hypothetical protein K2N77_10380 [Lachnospiraceae bacterium]|nr:hypothetical protein [Lachnospiraceae bacterium]
MEMQTREIPTKTKIIYIAIVCFVTLLLWLGDEGSRQLEYLGSEMHHSVGLIDSDYGLVVRETVAMNGIVAYTPEYVLNKGSYTAQMVYQAEEEDSVLELWEQNSKVAAWPLDPRQSKITADFTLSKDAKQIRLQINYGGTGSLTVKQLSLSPHTVFYTDTYFFMVLFLVCSLIIWLYVVQGRAHLTQERLTDFCVILGVALLATTPMMQTYLYNGDDLCYHLARLEGLKDGILDGQIPVNILPEGMQGNGYMNAMYPYLFLYIGAFLRICRVSLGLSYKTLIFLANLGSAICAYIAVKSMCKSRRSVILAVVLYTLMPYRFTNIFSRGDLGEILALTFWPLVIAGLYHIILGERQKWYYLVIGVSGILQSHILSAAFAAVICVITALVYCVRIVRERRYIEVGKAAGMFLLLNMWYLVPFIFYYFEKDLSTDVLRWSGYFEQSINPSNFTQSLSLYNKQYFSFGLALLGCVGIGVIRIICERDQKKTDKDGYVLYLFLLGVLLAYMTTGYFPSRRLLDNALFENIATMIQFPWRFLGPASACFLFVGAIGLERSQILRPYRNFIFAMLVGLNLLIIISVPADNSHMPYDNAEAVASKGHESKLGTSVGLFYPHEWRLGGATDESLTNSVIISDLNAIAVRQYQKKGTRAAAVYTATEEGGYIELPIQDYSGYRAYDENGKRLEIGRGDGARMRFTVQGDGIEHTIQVRYGPNPIFIAANLVSVLTILYCVWRRRKVHLRYEQAALQ